MRERRIWILASFSRVTRQRRIEKLHRREDFKTELVTV